MRNLQRLKYKRRNIAGWALPLQKDKAIFPLLVLSIRKRINAKQAVNIAVTGEAGVGKSYFGIQLAMKLDPKFDIEKQVVFSFKEFLEAIIELPMGRPIVFDEPSYAISKHDWYRQINNALRKTIESFRFKVHPLIIPVINIELLDKTVRSYLLQYHVILNNRGVGAAYRLSASQFDAKNYRTIICNIKWGLYKENCVKASCLGCRQLSNCDEWCAVYERIKAEIQDERYESSLEDVMAEELRNIKYSDEELEKLAIGLIDGLMTKDKIDAVKLKILLEEKHNVIIGRRKAYDIRKRMMMHGYPKTT